MQNYSVFPVGIVRAIVATAAISVDPAMRVVRHLQGLAHRQTGDMADGIRLTPSRVRHRVGRLHSEQRDDRGQRPAAHP